MAKKLIIGLVLAGFLVGCGSEDKKEEDTSVGTAATDEVIESQPITFDPLGSDSGNIPGLSTITFEYDKASLTDMARQTLDANAEWLRNNQGVNVQIEGHCDERGSVEYNLSLGERRARTVRDYMTNLGVDPNRLSVVSYGEEKPIAEGSSESAWSQNRRANFVPLQ